MSAWFTPTAQGYVLRLLVSPGARRTEVVGLHGDRLKVRLAAAPEKGAANRELIAFLARALNLPKNAFRLLGAQSRSKTGGNPRSLPGSGGPPGRSPDRLS